MMPLGGREGKVGKKKGYQHLPETKELGEGRDHKRKKKEVGGTRNNGNIILKGEMVCEGKKNLLNSSFFKYLRRYRKHFKSVLHTLYCS